MVSMNRRSPTVPFQQYSYYYYYYYYYYPDGTLEGQTPDYLLDRVDYTIYYTLLYYTLLYYTILLFSALEKHWGRSALFEKWEGELNRPGRLNRDMCTSICNVTL